MATGTVSCLNIWGMRWMNASPSNAPTAKLIKEGGETPRARLVEGQRYETHQRNQTDDSHAHQSQDRAGHGMSLGNRFFENAGAPTCATGDTDLPFRARHRPRRAGPSCRPDAGLGALILPRF